MLAYDDPLGVTAAFNRNLLVRINRELGGDVRSRRLRRIAPCGTARTSAIEMHLESRAEQTVRIEAAGVLGLVRTRRADLDGELVQVRAGPDRRDGPRGGLRA